jgi:hypothetical protein
METVLAYLREAHYGAAVDALCEGTRTGVGQVRHRCRAAVWYQKFGGFGIESSRSPALVESNLGRCPLR